MQKEVTRFALCVTLQREEIKMKTVYSLFLCVVFALFFSDCSKVNNDLPTPVASGERIHENAWADTTNVTNLNFHGKYLRDNDWNLNSCKKCHSKNYRGGVAPSCMSSGCHQDEMGMEKTPEACNTCHGNFRSMENDSASWAPPRTVSGDTMRTASGVGAHKEHLSLQSIHCSECHTVPSSISATGHLDGDNNAEIFLNDSLANIVTNEPTTQNYTASLPLFSPTPAYSMSSNTCSNVYCHGYFKNGNAAFSPVWTDTSASCGTCHGDVTKPSLAERALPGGTHPPVNSCFACHGTVVDASLNFINPTKHINGKLNLFSEERDF
jgi:predicted CxxxxCH...CXXCH cytochrome family protein